MSAVVLPPLLIMAGCCLHEVGRQLAVLDQEGHELARGPKKPTDWLWAASTAALIERQAVALGVCYELHPQELLFRLWCSGAGQAAAPWLSFDDALAQLAGEETARRRQLGCPEPITARSEQEMTEGRPRERRRGRAVPVGAHSLSKPSQCGRVASAEPIPRAQELQSPARGVSEHQDKRRPGRAVAVAGYPASQRKQRGRVALGEPITSRQELQSPGHSVTPGWWGAGSSPGRPACQAAWARDGPARGRGAACSGSITHTREPSGTAPALHVQQAMHLRCGRWP